MLGTQRQTRSRPVSGSSQLKGQAARYEIMTTQGVSVSGNPDGAKPSARHKKALFQRYGLPGEPGALLLPSLAPADVYTSRPTLPLRGIPSAPFRGTRTQPGTQHLLSASRCLVCLAVFIPATLNHALFPHIAVPSACAVPSAWALPSASPFRFACALPSARVVPSVWALPSASPIPSSWAALLYVFAHFLPAFQNPAQMSPLWHLL